DDEWLVIGHNKRVHVDRRYIDAIPSTAFGSGGLLSDNFASGCVLTVGNLDTGQLEDRFDFGEGKRGILSIGETKLALILMSACNVSTRSDRVCAFKRVQVAQ